MVKKNGKIMKLKKIKKINNFQQNNVLVNELTKLEKDRKKFEQEKLEKEKSKRGILVEEKPEKERGIFVEEKPEKERRILVEKKPIVKKTRLISKKQKKNEKNIIEFAQKMNKNNIELKKIDESGAQKMGNQNNIELKKIDEGDAQNIKNKNNINKYFEFIVQQYAGPLSVNFINIFSDLFSSTHIKKAYYLLLSAYNFFFSTNKMIASIILFSFEHANELFKK